jgi:hypothetical protein
MTDSKSEVSLGMAVLMLVAFALAWIAIQNKELGRTSWMMLEEAYRKNWLFLIIICPVSILNFLWLGGLVARRIGLMGQGARLRTLNGAISKEPFWSSFSLIGFVVGLIAALLAAYLCPAVRLPKIINTYWQAWAAVLAQPAIFAMLLFGRAKRLITYLKVRGTISRTLPKIPEVQNAVVLGSSFEGEVDRDPEWIVLGQRALNGAVLITGSIGCGKTQGAVLPYFRQILEQFEPLPAVMAIDPKRTFISAAIAICKKLGLEDRIRKISLEGSETFNPVFMENILENSRFLEVAEMLRAASINFSGKSSDSPFWEVSAFNLLKNVVVYSAATKGYFTLTDLYEGLVKATNDPLAEELRAALESKAFSAEEVFNIECAIRYFDDEYRQLDNRVRTGILATTTAFLNQFQDFRAAKVFCPSRDTRTIASMQDAIEQGQVIFLDIENPALARSMGTLLKLHYEKATLDRLTNRNRTDERAALLICDEYQDIVTCGGGNSLGDERYLAKCREANAIFIAASQSVTSIMNSVGKERAAKELVQNFRTRIACHSSDSETIKNMQELVGQRDIERVSHTLSETSHSPTRNLVLGGFDSPNANLSESVSISNQKEFEVTGREFSRLKSFEALSLVFDGSETKFTKLYLKPEFLKSKCTSHSDVLDMVKSPISAKRPKLAIATAFAWFAMAIPQMSFGFPGVCEIVKQPQFQSCLEWKVTPAMCGVPPHPCARISYYVPQSYIETTVGAGLSHFMDYPGAAFQLAAVPKTPFGAVDDEEVQAFHARSIAVPFAKVVLAGLPCGGTRTPKFCFDAMSEHFGSHWNTGSGDLLQPAFLAWKLSPKLCLLKGAVGAASTMNADDSAMCGTPVPPKLTFPPSSLPVCTPWGVSFPRYGTVDGPSEVIGSLLVAERIKSLAVEVLHTMPATPGEKWQMISPSSSQCFREFEHIPMLEGPKLVNNRIRVMGKDLQGNLFATWKQVSCLKEWAEVPVYFAQIAILQAVCQGAN